MLGLALLATVPAPLRSLLSDRLFKHPFTPFHPHKPVALGTIGGLNESFSLLRGNLKVAVLLVFFLSFFFL